MKWFHSSGPRKPSLHVLKTRVEKLCWMCISADDADESKLMFLFAPLIVAIWHISQIHVALKSSLRCTLVNTYTPVAFDFDIHQQKHTSHKKQVFPKTKWCPAWLFRVFDIFNPLTEKVSTITAVKRDQQHCLLPAHRGVGVNSFGDLKIENNHNWFRCNPSVPD